MLEASFQETGFMTKFPGNFQFHIKSQHPISPNTSSLYHYRCQVSNLDWNNGQFFEKTIAIEFFSQGYHRV